MFLVLLYTLCLRIRVKLFIHHILFIFFDKPQSVNAAGIILSFDDLQKQFHKLSVSKLDRPFGKIPLPGEDTNLLSR